MWRKMWQTNCLDDPSDAADATMGRKLSACQLKQWRSREPITAVDKLLAAPALRSMGRDCKLVS